MSGGRQPRQNAEECERRCANRCRIEVVEERRGQGIQEPWPSESWVAARLLMGLLPGTIERATVVRNRIRRLAVSWCTSVSVLTRLLVSKRFHSHVSAGDGNQVSSSFLSVPFLALIAPVFSLPRSSLLTHYLFVMIVLMGS